MSDQVLAFLDVFNSVFEVALIVPFVHGLRTLYRAKDSRAFSALEQWPYMLHALYTVLFFGALGRWWSAASLLCWAIAFAVKIRMIRLYRRQP